MCKDAALSGGSQPVERKSTLPHVVSDPHMCTVPDCRCAISYWFAANCPQKSGGVRYMKHRWFSLFPWLARAWRHVIRDSEGSWFVLIRCDDDCHSPLPINWQCCLYIIGKCWMSEVPEMMLLAVRLSRSFSSCKAWSLVSTTPEPEVPFFVCFSPPQNKSCVFLGAQGLNFLNIKVHTTRCNSSIGKLFQSLTNLYKKKRIFGHTSWLNMVMWVKTFSWSQEYSSGYLAYTQPIFLYT